MEPEEYTQIEERGPTRWLIGKIRENHPELRGASGIARAAKIMAVDNLKIRRSMKAWRRKGVESLVGPSLTVPPAELLSSGLRSFKEYLLDLFRYPDEVKVASRALIKPMIYLSMLQVKMSGIPRAYLGSARTSASFRSPKQFVEFALPALMEMCDYYTRRDISVVLHLDDDWTPFFHYFKDLPRGTYIINLDGKSDIFKAKEILGDQMCIMGDVPADLLKLGEPDEVDEYCRRLIMEVGAEGGFILSSGCSMPADAKPENVRAMIRSVQKYRP